MRVNRVNTIAKITNRIEPLKNYPLTGTKDNFLFSFIISNK